MKRNYKTLILLAIGCCGMAIGAYGQQKIGHVSLEEIMALMPETKKADSILTDYKEALNQASLDKQAAFNSAIEKFNRDSSGMSAALKEVKRNTLLQMAQDLQQEDERNSQSLQNKQQSLVVPLQQKALKALEAVAKKNAYQFVFIREALLVYPPTGDISALVKKELGL